VFSDLYGKDLIAYGTGNLAKRIVPYLAGDPNIRLLGITNSRIKSDDEGTFMDTGLPVRSIHAWAGLLPEATILITAFEGMREIVEICKNEGFHKFEYVTWEKMSILAEMEAELAQSQQSKMLEQLCFANELHDTHKAAFSEFKACNKGKTVAVVGTGPTLNYYSQLAGVSHIGVNASFLKKELTLDYYFITHYNREWCEKLKDYNFYKFFDVGIRSRKSKDQFPEYVIEENDGRRYFSMPMMSFDQIRTNIDCYPLMGYGSIIFRAIHFALYTQPRKLLLVGCDCALSGHFDGLAQSVYDEQLYIPRWIDGYKTVKRFASLHYPDMEIISVNPVGLKGMFHDLYTERYLDDHTELDRLNCEILDLKKFEQS